MELARQSLSLVEFDFVLALRHLRNYKLEPLIRTATVGLATHRKISDCSVQVGSRHNSARSNARCTSAKGRKRRFGSKAPFRRLPAHFRSSPITGHPRCPSACLKRANARSRCAPARCAGARAERPAAGREDSDGGGWQGQHDQLMYCRRATHDQEQQGSSGRPAP